MLNLNPTTLAAVAEKAAHDAANHPRWLVALGRAIVELDSNPFLERAEHGGLIIGSPSGACYTSNGVCQCPSYNFGQPCWHRAAARLVRLHDEYEVAAAGRADQARLARQIAAARATALLNECFA
jgi:hypothetical protein